MSGAVTTRRRVGRQRPVAWLVLALAAVVGVAVLLVVSDHPQRASLSYLGGLALAVGSLEFGALNIRLADLVAPGLTLAAAVFSYLSTVVLLGLVLAASSPRVVDPKAIGIGLLTALAIWLGGLIAASWVPTERPDPPVSIPVHDESPTTRQR